MAGPGNILIRIGAETASAVAGIGRVDKALGDSMTRGQKATAMLGKAALPAAAALTAIGAAAVSAGKAAAEDAAAQAKLAGTLERTTGATSAQVAAAEDYISALSRQTGIADDDLRPALGKLATATGDVGTAQKALNTALDVSAQTGKSLDSVSTALAKGYAGQTTALNRLVPGIDQAAIKSKDMNKVMADLTDLTGGAAAQAAGTAAGQYQILQTQMGELQESLGAGLLPIMQAFIPILTEAADWVAKNAKTVQILVGVIAALAGGILAANAAMKVYQAAQIAIKVATAAWTAAQWLLNAALSANPIGLVIVAVAALAAGIVIAYQKSETFRNICQAAFNAVKVAIDAVAGGFKALLSAATAAFNWIVANWKVALFAFGPIGAAVSLIASNFNAIKSAATAAWNFIKSAWTVADFAFGPIEAAVHAIASAFSAITGAVQGAINAVNALISALGRIHVPSIHLPDLNPFSAAAPAYAGVGFGRARTGGGATATAGGSGITINVYGAVDPEGTARQINRLLFQHARRQGRTK